MAYIGKQPVVGNFVKLDAITTSATTTFNLLNGGVAYFPQTANNCIVSLNGVIQSPTSAYTISGSTIVFSDALTASDSIDFILVLGDVLAIGTPSDGTVTNAKIAASTIDLTTKVTGTLPVANGGTGLAALGTAGQALVVNSGATALQYSTVGGTNTPAFMANRTAGSQSFTTSTATKYQASNEIIDTDNCYNTSTYRFTPTTAGKYFIYFRLLMNFAGTNPSYTAGMIYKNGSEYATSTNNAYGSNPGQVTQHITSAIITFNGSTDYVEPFVNSNSNAPVAEGSTTVSSEFGGYKLIGV